MEQVSPPPSASEGTASLDKALDILDVIGEHPQGLSQSELAARLPIPRTTLYRLLATLIARGLVRRDPQRRIYLLGFRCFELARRVHDSPDLVAAAIPEMRSLRDLTGETCYLAVLDGLEALSLERVDGAHSHRSQAALGQRKPLHCTSQGKAMLAALPPARRDALLRELPLKPLTPRSLSDRRQLLAELKITAARGWSIDDEEIALGVRCVGAPVLDAQGQVRGAISLAGPAWRMTHERVEALGPELAEAGRRIGAQLGAMATPTSDSQARVLGEDWAFRGAFAHWLPEPQALIWADALGPTLLRWDGQSTRVLAEFEAPLLGLCPWQGGWLVAQPQQWLALDAQGQVRRSGPWPEPDAQVLALSEGPGDSLWLSLTARDGRHRVQAWSPEGAARAEPAWTLDQPMHCLRWNAGKGVLWCASQVDGSIRALKSSQSQRRLATLPQGSGRVSDMVLDSEGGLWAALQDGWSVLRFSPEGHLDRVIALPVPSPTGLSLDEAGRTLFITTARQARSVESLHHAPLAGRLLAVAL